MQKHKIFVDIILPVVFLKMEKDMCTDRVCMLNIFQ